MALKYTQIPTLCPVFPPPPHDVSSHTTHWPPSPITMVPSQLVCPPPPILPMMPFETAKGICLNLIVPATPRLKVPRDFSSPSGWSLNSSPGSCHKPHSPVTHPDPSLPSRSIWPIAGDYCALLRCQDWSRGDAQDTSTR